MNEKELRRELERWDPAVDREPPATLRERTRVHLEKQSAARGRRAPDRTLAILAGLAAVLVAVFALRLTESRPEPRGSEPVTASLTAEPPVPMVYTASNGVRIYWNVPAAGPTRN